jgi:hypothetical protein
VIIITPDTFETIRTTVGHLVAQTIASRIELVICTPMPDELAMDERAVIGLHSVRVVRSAPLSTSGPTRARGAREATAPIIVYSEDHCYPDPGWAEALLAAHREPHAAIGPAVRNANPESLVSWADLLMGYGPWIAPGRGGVVTLLPGHNSSYKRDVLLTYGPELDALMEAETVLFWDLQRRGHTLYFEPRAIVAHVNFSRLSIWFPVQWDTSRSFSAMRALAWSYPRKLAFALASPLIPLLRLTRIVRSALRNGLGLTSVAKVLPLLMAGLTVDAAAQATGTLAGPGVSTMRMSAREFHRMRLNRG